MPETLLQLQRELEGLGAQGMEPDPLALSELGAYMVAPGAPGAVVSGGGITLASLVAGAGPAGVSMAPAPAELPALGGIAAAVPAAAEVLGISLPAWLPAALGAAAAGYGAYQALGGGAGGGIGGLNILGGDFMTVGGVELGGPGLPEPAARNIKKEWRVRIDSPQGDYNLQYYLLYKPKGKVLMYNTRTKQWKYWTLRRGHLAVIGKNMPRHQMIVRLRRNLSRHSADARSILRITSPKSLHAPRRVRR